MTGATAARLLLRTPRLELRWPTPALIAELYEVAAGGIHPAEEMPFAVPWTDGLERAAFLAYHLGCLRGWSPQRWACNLVTLVDGAVVGTQGLEAEGFAERRQVGTGSWLGAAYQGRGYGTEQRAAVLELAFRGLGALAADSGALEGNAASQRVSEKLGYRAAGESVLCPRGEPVRQTLYRLAREDWRCPFPVEIEGLDACRELFGAA